MDSDVSVVLSVPISDEQWDAAVYKMWIVFDGWL
jgi:hypothetical protein